MTDKPYHCKLCFIVLICFEVMMMELTLFLNAFLSYGLVFVVFAAAIVIAFLIGFGLRKNKNKKEAAEKQA